MFFDSIIFDFDYTLADGTDAIVACYNYAFSKMGYNDGEREAVRRTVGMTVRDSIKQLTGCTDPEKVEKMRLLFREKADEILAKNTHLYSDTVPMLNLLKENKIKTAIVSSKEKIRIEESLELGGGKDLIGLIIGVSSAPEPKPSPSGVNMALKELCAEKALYVGDSLIDFQTAKNAGLPFAAVTTGTTSKEDFIKANADGEVKIFGIFESLSELSKSLFTNRTLYVTDIDGTLKKDKDPICDKKKDLLRQITANGTLFTAATARGINSALTALSGIDVTAPLITLSGVEEYDPKTGKITRYPLSNETVNAIFKYCNELSLDLFIYRAKKGDKTLYISHGKLYSEAANRFKEMRKKVNGQIFVNEEDLNPSNDEEYLYAVVIGDEPSVLELKSSLLSEFPLVKTERFTESVTSTCYLEIFSEKGGKGNAARRAKNAAFANRVVAFGDNLNDLSFKEIADEFYTVENALPEVKAEALGIIKSGFVADFIASREGIISAVLINDAACEDIPTLTRLEKQSFEEFYSENQLLKAVESKTSHIIVAKEAGVVTGYLIADIYADFAEIDKIFTLESQRKRGIAKMLHNELLKRARENGSEKILLEVRSKNPARAFYEKLGYETDGIRKNYYKNDDAVLMSLTLK